MNRKKQLIKLAEKAALESMNKGKIDTKKVKLFTSQFGKLPLSEAIISLESYAKALSREIDKITLTIESAVAISGDQIKKLELLMSKEFKIQKTEKVLNPSLLGGFRFKIGDMVFDNSLKNKITEIGDTIRG